MIRSIVLFAVLALAIPLQAQEEPDAPKPKEHLSCKVYVAGVSLLAAAKTADARLLASSLTCRIPPSSQWKTEASPMMFLQIC